MTKPARHASGLALFATPVILMECAMVRLCVLLFLSLALSSPAWSSGVKTDIVVLKNGDRITGEIKRLQARLLEFSTDAMGTILIEWRYIQQVISDKNQSVETTDGRRYLGKLTSLEGGEEIGVDTDHTLVKLASDDVFSVWPVDASFWDRTDFDISIGFDYAKSTDITSLSLSADWEHRRYDRLTQSSLRSNLTQQPGTDDQQRTQISWTQQYIQPNRRFRSWITSGESNESLDLDYRVLGGGAYGKYLMRRTNQWFSVAGGLAATYEKYFGSPADTSLEGILNAEYNLFRYADPERSLKTRLTLFPSLTEWGRIRSDFRTTFKLEIIADLYWSAELYYQSDSEPPPQALDSTDYGISTSFGWSP
jgi:hypothetical protein